MGRLIGYWLGHVVLTQPQGLLVLYWYCFDLKLLFSEDPNPSLDIAVVPLLMMDLQKMLFLPFNSIRLSAWALSLSPCNAAFSVWCRTRVSQLTSGSQVSDSAFAAMNLTSSRWSLLRLLLGLTFIRRCFWFLWSLKLLSSSNVTAIFSKYYNS